MKKLGCFAVDVVKTIVIGGSAWDFTKRIVAGFRSGEVGFSITPLTELCIFLLSDWFWVILTAYGLIRFIPIINKKIQHANAEREKRKSEKRKQEIREVLQEVTIKK
ncbi:hypothetical protein RGU12_12535 [Fredinandcohnia sp. QZ13]|uniref:hypothetical protein n=1 Tax=Fredinandcohnia sp. QZ13 TaxID=3073144 RepID=UPI0028532C3C|nr:hypothetical protein [Fredinandcohnia sp. QZ13]MDR4888363.1 hypothetical protein [Fredinandcohnia sp. QZ13]